MYRRKTLYAVEAPGGALFLEGEEVLIVCMDGSVVTGEISHVGASVVMIHDGTIDFKDIKDIKRGGVK